MPRKFLSAPNGQTDHSVVSNTMCWNLGGVVIDEPQPLVVGEARLAEQLDIFGRRASLAA